VTIFPGARSQARKPTSALRVTSFPSSVVAVTGNFIGGAEIHQIAITGFSPQSARGSDLERNLLEFMRSEGVNSGCRMDRPFQPLRVEARERHLDAGSCRGSSASQSLPCGSSSVTFKVEHQNATILSVE